MEPGEEIHEDHRQRGSHTQSVVSQEYHGRLIVEEERQGIEHA